MNKIRRRKKKRSSNISTNRWPLYIPDDEIGWFNNMSDYIVNDVNVSVSHLLRRLLFAWEKNEVEAGKKKPFLGGPERS